MSRLPIGKNILMTYEQPGRRPGTVTAAAVIVIVLHGLFALGALAGVVAGIWLAVSPQAAAQAQEIPGLGAALTAVGGGGLAVLFVLLLAFSILMILFSIQALRGRNWARIVSTVFLGLGILGNLGGMVGPPQQPGGSTGSGLVGLVLMVLALVFYWLPPSNRWFSTLRGRRAERPQATRPPPPEPGSAPG